MTTLTEIAELRTEMNAKFERVYDEMAEFKGELHGVAQDLKELRQEVRQDIKEVRQDINGVRQDVKGVRQDVKGINSKLDQLETDVAAILVILKQQPPGDQL